MAKGSRNTGQADNAEPVKGASDTQVQRETSERLVQEQNNYFLHGGAPSSQPKFVDASALLSTPAERIVPNLPLDTRSQQTPIESANGVPQSGQRAGGDPVLSRTSSDTAPVKSPAVDRGTAGTEMLNPNLVGTTNGPDVRSTALPGPKSMDGQIVANSGRVSDNSGLPVAPAVRTDGVVANPERNPGAKVSDAGSVRPTVDAQSPASTKSNPFTFTTNENNQVTVTRRSQSGSDEAPSVRSAGVESKLPPPSYVQDGGQPKPVVIPESQPRATVSEEQPAGQNRTGPQVSRDGDVPSTTSKGNTGAATESSSLIRPYSVSSENPNQAKPANLTPDAQSRTQQGALSDIGSRDAAVRDNFTRANVSGNALDSQPKATSNEKSPLVSESRQPVSDATGTRAVGPQTSMDVQGKQNPNTASSEFGTRRESGVQLPDTKQAGTRAESGLQLPDTKQSSGRTDTGGTKLPDTRNETGRNDANTAKLPDAKTLANLDQKFGEKVNPPGKGSGVPIAIPGIPDILGGLRGDKDGKTVKDAKTDSQGPKDGAVRNEAPGGREVKDGKGESQGSKDSKASDGKGDTKSGADDKGVSGQKGIRLDAEGVKISDGKPAQDVRNTTQDGKGADGKPVDGRPQGGSNLVHDGGSKSEGSGDGKTRIDQTGARAVDADGKAIGGRADSGSAIKGDLGDKVHADASSKGQIDGGGKGHVDAGSKGQMDAGGKGHVDAGSKGQTDVGGKGQTDVVGKGQLDAGGKVVGAKGDAPFVLPPGSLPVPDLVGGIKNVGQQIDGRTGKPTTADETGLRQPEKVDGIKPGSKAIAGDGVKTVVTGAPGDGVKTAVTGGVAGDGVKTAVTGGAKVGEGVKSASTSDSSADGKQLVGKNPTGTKSDGAIIVPPSAVPLTEMIGNLKGIAARIFPPESRTGRPDAFDNSLPGRKTERLEDRTQAILGAGVRADSTIPIVRAIGDRTGKGDEQFVIRLHQPALDTNKAPQFKTESAVPTPPRIAPEQGVSGKPVPGLKSADASAVKSADANAVKSTDAKAVRHDVQHIAPKSGDPQVQHTSDQVVHDEAAESLLVNLELVGSVESAPATESDEEEVFPLAALEYFGGEFEKTISDEEDVMFDGDGNVADDDEQSTRYQYIVEAGDTVELIAIKVFKNVTLAPLIYEINKDAIPIGMLNGKMVFTLKVGTVIWLPFPKEVKAYMQT